MHIRAAAILAAPPSRAWRRTTRVLVQSAAGRRRRIRTPDGKGVFGYEQKELGTSRHGQNVDTGAYAATG